MPRVSVIIPAYNAEAFLARALRSVVEQTFDDYEVVLVDDGSTDGTAEIAQSFKQVRYFHQPNRRQPATRNRGLKEAKGELIAFLDADDEWLPEKLERQLAFMDERDSQISFTDTYVSSKGKRAGRYSELVPPCDGDILLGLLRQSFITINTVVARKELLDRFDENVPFRSHEDYDLWLRLALAGTRFDYLNEPLAVYHRGYASDSSDRISMHERYLEVLEHFDSSYDLPPEARNQVSLTLNRTDAALGRMLLQQGRLREAAPHLRRVAPDSMRHRLLRASGRVLSLFFRSE
jgi:glycosyltransferase involved in cell wall biosynthesis